MTISMRLARVVSMALVALTAACGVGDTRTEDYRTSVQHWSDAQIARNAALSRDFSNPDQLNSDDAFVKYFDTYLSGVSAMTGEFERLHPPPPAASAHKSVRDALVDFEKTVADSVRTRHSQRDPADPQLMAAGELAAARFVEACAALQNTLASTNLRCDQLTSGH